MLQNQYFTPILLLWGLELVFLILLPAFKSLLYSTSAWLGRFSLDFYKGEMEEKNLVSFFWNNVMAQLECCGVNNYTDFTYSAEWQRSKLNLQVISRFDLFILTFIIQLVPSSCCILDQTEYPQTISPQDAHCVFVPTKYNSHWMQVT